MWREGEQKVIQSPKLGSKKIRFSEELNPSSATHRFAEKRLRLTTRSQNLHLHVIKDGSTGIIPRTEMLKIWFVEPTRQGRQVVRLCAASYFSAVHTTDRQLPEEKEKKKNTDYRNGTRDILTAVDIKIPDAKTRVIARVAGSGNSKLEIVPSGWTLILFETLDSRFKVLDIDKGSEQRELQS